MTTNTERHIVTLDGQRGTGKSQLAKGLRQVFDCGVFEIGPVFRLISWMIVNGEAVDAAGASTMLLSELAQGRTRFCLDRAGSLSSMSIERARLEDNRRLWASELDPTLRMIAASGVGVAAVLGLAKLAIGEKHVVVVGREAGTRFFPMAGLRIELRSDDPTRLVRKALQLEREVAGLNTDYSPDSSEPAGEWSLASADLIIDTTQVPPATLLEDVSRRIERDLAWPKRENGVRP